MTDNKSNDNKNNNNDDARLQLMSQVIENINENLANINKNFNSFNSDNNNNNNNNNNMMMASSIDIKSATLSSSFHQTSAEPLSSQHWQQSHSMIFLQALISFSFFMLLFIYLNKNLRHMSKRLQSISDGSYRHILVRINSSIHAGVTTLLAIYVMLTDSQLNPHNLHYSTFIINLTLNIVLGYMFYDIVLMLFYKDIFDLASIAHHVVVIIAYYSGSVTSLFGLTCIFRLVSEASTPFINLRWTLLELKMSKTKLYFYNGLIILALFGLVRIAAIVPHWYIIYSYMHSIEWTRIHVVWKIIGLSCGFPLDILNIYWFIKIIRNARKHLKRVD